MRFHIQRVVLGLVISGATAGLAVAQADQDERQAALQGKLEKKLASEFMKKADWQTDYDAVRAKAAKSGEVIFAYFTRSYSP